MAPFFHYLKPSKKRTNQLIKKVKFLTFSLARPACLVTILAILAVLISAMIGAACFYVIITIFGRFCCRSGRAGAEASTLAYAHCSTSINDDSIILYNYTEATSQRVRWLRLSSTDQARTPRPIIECALAAAAPLPLGHRRQTPRHRRQSRAAWQPPSAPLPRQLTRAHSQRYGITPRPAVSRQTCTCAVSPQTFQPTGPARRRRRHAAVGSKRAQLGITGVAPAPQLGCCPSDLRQRRSAAHTAARCRRHLSVKMTSSWPSFGPLDSLCMYYISYIVLTYLARGPPWPNIRLLTIWERADCY